MNYIPISQNEDGVILSKIPKKDKYKIKQVKKINKSIFHKIIEKNNIIIILNILIIFIFIIISINLLSEKESNFNNNIIKQLLNSLIIPNISKDEEINTTDIIDISNNNTEIKRVNKEDIYKEEKFSSRVDSFNKAKKFLENNNRGILIHEIPLNLIENPIASAVIPVYNSKNYISRAIKSIQNQNISNIEIILVNDFSTDDTLSFIENIQKEDKRIKIIKNKKNMGILYSRSIGVLHAHGKYIFPLDNDDMFLDEDVFDVVTKIAVKGDFDIIEFKAITTFNYKSGKYKNRFVDSAFSGHKLNLVLFQPELGRFPLQPGKKLDSYHLESVFLWAKCYKTEIYKEALNKLGENKYSRFMLRHEDCIANYFLFNTAKSYKFIGKYGVIHIERDSSASQKFTKNDEDIYNIYLLDVMIDFVLDTYENKKILVHLIVFLLNRNSLIDTLNMNDNIKTLFLNCLDKILNMNNIDSENKNIIIDKSKNLNLK